MEKNTVNAVVLSLALFLGLTGLGYLLAESIIDFKRMDRTVVVKGLSEREYPADQVVWPIQFSLAGNDLKSIYTDLERNSAHITSFLLDKGITDEQIVVGLPSITDKSAQAYGGATTPEFRFVATNTITVATSDVANVRAVMRQLAALGKEGIVFTGDSYQAQTEYLFTTLNDVKPDMVEEATRNAREVAEKFAKDSDSKLGKIRTASQGQFSISDRDRNNPQIKKLRVVSTIEYYLTD